jgi:hypothetical protein
MHSVGTWIGCFYDYFFFCRVFFVRYNSEKFDAFCAHAGRIDDELNAIVNMTQQDGLAS